MTRNREMEEAAGKYAESRKPGLPGGGEAGFLCDFQRGWLAADASALNLLSRYVMDAYDRESRDPEALQIYAKGWNDALRAVRKYMETKLEQ